MLKDKARFTFIAAFVFNIIFLTVVLVILWIAAKRGEKDDSGLPMLCLGSTCGCRTETLDNYLKQAFEEKFQSEESKRKTRQQIYLKENRDKFETLRKKGFIWNIRPIARLSGSKQALREGDMTEEMTPLRTWEKKRSNCYVSNGIDYRNGRLAVPVTGYYHVYSFLDMLMEYCDKNGNSMVKNLKSDAALRHTIFKYNIKDGREEEVISSYKPYHYSQNRRFNFYETYISADVLLNPGDEVYIKVSNASYLQNPSKNFFGIHML